ncbi:MAG: pantoate--beta-alanine ligase [Cytophagales bacterium]|nr:pantoate--beta-alanine ligase [Cytophagales bacterium]
MLIFYTIADIRQYIKSLHNKKIGLVPTMGALHEGHMSLIHHCKSVAEVVVCSIFVNPIQFNNLRDFEAYPYTPDSDVAKLREAGCDVLFAPSADEMYAIKPNLSINFGYHDTVMEGKHRPGHFSGVGIVVGKLLNIIKPNVACFGQKDYQQTLIVRQLIHTLNFDTKLEIIPTLREPDGLAMSSRNVRIPQEYRRQACQLYKSLEWFAQNIYTYPLKDLKSRCSYMLVQHGFEPEYIEVTDYDTGILVEQIVAPAPMVVCAAAIFHGVRLIDNVLINE